MLKVRVPKSKDIWPETSHRKKLKFQFRARFSTGCWAVFADFLVVFNIRNTLCPRIPALCYGKFCYGKLRPEETSSDVGNPSAIYRRLPGPPGQKTRRSLSKSLTGPPAPEPPESLERVFRDLFQTFQTLQSLLRLFPDSARKRAQTLEMADGFPNVM